jgi:hypothetical protein
MKISNFKQHFNQNEIGAKRYNDYHHQLKFLKLPKHNSDKYLKVNKSDHGRHTASVHHLPINF